jgi:chorismate synthase
MASNSFGKIFSITTFGESHGETLGVIIDGCPAGLSLDESDIHEALSLRQPGKSGFVSPRFEKDRAKIMSGIFEGKTTGTPIAIFIENTAIDSSQYESIKNILRPGHANFAYLEKYGIFDHRGGGRASARETACRVAAGAVAMKILDHYEIRTAAFVKSIGNVQAEVDTTNIKKLKEETYTNSVFCPDKKSAKRMMDEIIKLKAEGDSIGGVVEFIIANVPAGLGEPIYNKLEASLANAMMSIPAAKGFEIGDGFNVATMKGSENNDEFITVDEKISTKTNHAGGVLAGISNGMPIIGRVAFKPTPSIMKAQKTVDLQGNKALLQLPDGSRHDVCVAIRAVPVVEAMCALVIADALLLNRSARLDCGK